MRPGNRVLRVVKTPISIRIVGAPTAACGGSVGDGWRATATMVAAQMARRFGDAVSVEYYDLFEPHCPAVPPGAQLPLVTVGEDVLSSGGKISLPAIRRRLETLLAESPQTQEGA